MSDCQHDINRADTTVRVSDSGRITQCDVCGGEWQYWWQRPTQKPTLWDRIKAYFKRTTDRDPEDFWW